MSWTLGLDQQSLDEIPETKRSNKVRHIAAQYVTFYGHKGRCGAIAGGPGRLNCESYDIVSKAEGNATRPELG